MCGFAGQLLWDPTACVTDERLHAMGESMVHRGPDGAGVWSDGPVGFAHRRLSILGVESGAQPLSSADERIWVVFNGEIYNFHPLRRELEARGHRFRTETDTEVLVYLWLEHGPDMLERLTGMFAFALWDRRERTLFLARDRVGIKPLYYAVTSEGLLFGSEVKALLASGALQPEVDTRVVERFFYFDYVPGSQTLMKGVSKLPPAHFLLHRTAGDRTGATELAEPRRYWDLPHEQPARDISLEEAAEELEELFDRVVEEHLLSDVPVGVLASGGLDSTAVLSSASRAAGSLDTFTVGFADPSVTDERPYARVAADHFGARHHEVSVDPADFWNFLPSYIWHMEEPVCEPPAIALHTVAKLASKHVKVVLSGEGGDEAFAGYSTYPLHLGLERLKAILGPVRRPTAALLSRLARGMGAPGRRLAPSLARLGLDLEEHYWSRTSHPFRWFPTHQSGLLGPALEAVADRQWSLSPAREALARCAGAPLLTRMLYTDTVTWLPDDLLIKADKMTMATSLELRVPLLDHRILEYAAVLPQELKIKGKTTKRVLRQVFQRRVPRAILDRPKAGFPVPYGRWLRGELAASVKELLLDTKTVERGYFRKEGVETLLARHAAGAPVDKEVFDMVVLELWHRAFMEIPSGSHS